MPLDKASLKYERLQGRSGVKEKLLMGKESLNYWIRKPTGSNGEKSTKATNQTIWQTPREWIRVACSSVNPN